MLVAGRPPCACRVIRPPTGHAKTGRAFALVPAVRAPARAAVVHAAKEGAPVLQTGAGADLASDSWDDVFEEAELAAEASAPVSSQEVRSSRNRAFLVGVATQSAAGAATLSIEDSLDELAHLADTAGLEVVGRTFQSLRTPDGRTYVGTGKLQELLEEARSLDVDTLIFDDELRPSQARNVERAAVAAGSVFRVCDRCVRAPATRRASHRRPDTSCCHTSSVELILEIFRQRAATREGFLQTQLARTLYQMPRLSRLWTHLERQSGGGGLAAKGMGESQLEIDKRLLRVQAARIREKLERCASMMQQLDAWVADVCDHLRRGCAVCACTELSTACGARLHLCR
jgi:hypothetical protein